MQRLWMASVLVRGACAIVRLKRRVVKTKKDTRPFFSTLDHLRRVDLSVDLYEGHCNRGYCIDMIARWISWA